jgi:D-arabinose 1-dehydrogenase-like Zn-dependent alcohol dehydrogenase
MTLEFTVFGGSKSGEIVETKTHREIGPREVAVDITHSGVCGTDEHFRHVDQGLGHEGVGVVTALGALVPEISDVKVGDRVGLGWFQKTCGYCKQCLLGKTD